MRIARAAVVKGCALSLTLAAAAWASTCFSAVYVGGDSMVPTMMRGDLLLVARDASGASAGDAVLFDKPGWPAGVVHRVVAVTFDERLRLKGDANLTPDREELPRAALRGVVVLVLPTGRVIAVLDALARMVQSPVT